MKRDIDLVRKLLLALESDEIYGDTYTIRPNNFKIEGYDLEADETFLENIRKINYHLRLLDDAKLIAIDINSAGQIAVQRLTWEGHEFLDAARDDKVWKKVKREVAEKGGGFTIDIVKALAIRFLNDQFGLG